MRRHEKSQRVDIDEYFQGFEDGADFRAIEASLPMEAFLTAQPFKAILTGKVDQASSVLAPYHRQSRGGSGPKLLNSLELESAHRAVFSIKSQLVGDPDPSIPTQVYPPDAWDVTPENSSGAEAEATTPVSSAFAKFFHLRPHGRTQGLSRLWRGSLITLAGTTVVAMALYAYSPAYLQPYLTQAQTLSRLSLVQVRHLGRQLLAQADRATAKSPLGIMAHRSEDHGAMAQAMELAYTAAELTQSATTHEDWLQVITFWRRAIDELQPIPAQSHLFPSAQARRQLYQSNLAYAQGELEMAPFRLAVNAAESASQMAASASTLEDWADVAATWQDALRHMESVSTQSSRHGVAQEKLAEYAAKFAYSQGRYLTLQAQDLR
ncbi:hypothetical protein GFS31_07230 [Leptolyngbya sp. BL0902]|uniref:hypothetical protein n=1 Tax=Leptolyngbya sp. BL0902 TaxID=1115757 RepID=UPI0018E8F505|nr:hypothetical protein [Leptolyngbya sp. BL0902]QQE64051.1 hypothetical protein GFS31_07230 [Leptolyngbya sp. BL0902]